MSIAEVKEILSGNFTDENDRQYWIEKLKQLERKKANNKENEKYYKAMSKYNRLNADIRQQQIVIALYEH